jgi:hypothetical protein
VNLTSRVGRIGLTGLLVSGLLTACAGRFDPLPATSTLSDDAAVELDTQWCGDMVFVEAMIHGAGPYRLVLDTGAASTVLDERVVAEAGVELRSSRRTVNGSGGGTVAIAGIARIEAMDVVGVDGRSWTVADFDVNVLELEAFDLHFGQRFDGILGYPAFLGLTVELDYPAQRVSVLPTRLEPDAPLAAGVGRFTHADVTRPIIDVALGDETIPVLLDTGSGGSISLVGVDQWPLLADPVLTGATRGVDGLRTATAARLDGTLALGPVVFVEPIVADDAKLARLGGEVMRRFVWRFDPGRRLVELQSSLAEPIAVEPLLGAGFIGDFTPVELDGLERGIEVLALIPNSPAARDGVEPGDIVVRVDGEPIPGACQRRASRPEREAGQAFVLEVVRGGEILEITTEIFTLIE